MKTEVIESKRKSLHATSELFCSFATKDDFIEVTKWTNGEGFDVEFGSRYLPSRCQMTWGQWRLLQKLVKKLAI